MADEIARTDSRASLLLAFNGTVLADLVSVTDKGYLVANVVEEQERHRRQGQSAAAYTSAGQAWTAPGMVSLHTTSSPSWASVVAGVQLALDPRAEVAGVRELVAVHQVERRAHVGPRFGRRQVEADNSRVRASCTRSRVATCGSITTQSRSCSALVMMRMWAGRRGKIVIGRPPWEAFREAVGASERASSVAGQR
ncbi:hypothetical protein ACFVY7_18260 [[Kitasatospora] papulosa]|uniref:hypothetical protein n=1 Tax=Streptomyces TaxID=1883 RepID=UPI0023B0306D|nr:hypothetical protein [Streptomyces sp. KA12]MDF0376548.1 hypothetical protein [Streptomyces sp. KA12]